jgi:hypothetical protein
MSNFGNNTIYLLGVDENGDPADVPFPSTMTQDYGAVDLLLLYAKGTPGDTLTLVGEGVAGGQAY